MLDNTPNSLSPHLSLVRNLLPAVDTLLSCHKNSRLGDFVDHLSRSQLPALQCNEDFIVEMSRHAEATLGDGPAKAIYEDLHESPQVLTANHHGIDTFGQSTQSNLLFSMRKKSDGRPFKTVPVLACGSVPLNNLTYPRGFLIYASSAIKNNGIYKLPLFPDSYKRKLVSKSGPFNDEMLNRSRLRTKKLAEDCKLAPSLETALNAVFDDCAGVTQKFANYSQQATVVNHRLWKRLFRDNNCRSELVYIELESLVSRLLQKDLFDKSSIFHQLVFDPQLRRRLVERLDGHRGCWQYENLVKRCCDAVTGDFNIIDSAQGTMFFWGIDDKNRKIPLCVARGQSRTGYELRGADDKGQLWTIPFTPFDVSQGLIEGRLLPSIFTSYLLVAIARGVNCIGGYYQADYLPIMREAVIETLQGGFDDAARTDLTENISPDLYLSGMQTVGLESDDQLLTAGPLEIIASGGLDEDQYEQIGDITVMQSHIASLYDTIIDVVPRGGNFFVEENEIPKLVYDAVADKILTISIS